VELIAPGIHQIDTLLGGMDRMTAGFLVDGPQPALVETGSQTSVAAVRDALTGAGLGPDDLRWIIVTHIHLDHAGGVGDMAAAFPNATVVVHERGARHLLDPTRLIDSAARVYGPLLDGLYGRMLPVPQDRLVAAAGMLTAAAGFLFLSGWTERSLQPQLLGLPLRLADAELLLAGLGLGLEIAPVSAAVLDAVSDTQRGAGAAVLIVMRLLGMLVGFSLLAGYGLYQFHQATAHLLPPIPTLLPDFPVRYATYVLHLRQALIAEYHLIFLSTAIALVIGGLVAAVTLRPLPRARWR